MSRIGNKPITLKKEIIVSLNKDRKILVKNAQQSLQVVLHDFLNLKQEESKIYITREKEDKKTRALHGLTQALLQNAVTGLTTGWSKTLELNGVGYRAKLSGDKLELNLGFSHPISYSVPKNINIKIEKQIKIHISGVDKELVGLVAHQIRDYRPVEPYLAKGIKYSDEHIKRKVGKSGGEKK